jgi:hypothetical protein
VQTNGDVASRYGNRFITKEAPAWSFPAEGMQSATSSTTPNIRRRPRSSAALHAEGRVKTGTGY